MSRQLPECRLINAAGLCGATTGARAPERIVTPKGTSATVVTAKSGTSAHNRFHSDAHRSVVVQR